ncbi:LysR substrate-binding domain-containing protein [Burkholderia sp. Cy-637]|uniref:LysR substrate-binding domain-containing protein n=1 Tax=Burkholderia sp. Cy-637 TaxID=2608327 RepID=UPI0014241B01|nr:LysR family transcriptional regulator [Burkholderia sp. Cy-637]
MSLRRGIPSLTALQAFEASARHQSFSKAAAELQLTHGAICKKVNELEASLGVELFRRVSQRLVLTEAGADYAHRIRLHLEQIRQDTQQLLAQGERSTLRVAVGVTFGAQWLVPRLPRFHARHANIQLRLTGRDQATYFQDLNFDAAIHFEKTLLPGLAGRVLIADDELWIVAAPGRVEGADPARIAAMPWIHARDLPGAWMNWAEAAATPRAEPHGGDHFFDFFIMAIQAAVAGLGLALLPRLLIETELREGRLVRVGDYATVNAQKTYLLYPEQKQDSAPLVTFAGWLEGEMAEYRASRDVAR